MRNNSEEKKAKEKKKNKEPRNTLKKMEDQKIVNHE